MTDQTDKTPPASSPQLESYRPGAERSRAVPRSPGAPAPHAPAPGGRYDLPRAFRPGAAGSARERPRRGVRIPRLLLIAAAAGAGLAAAAATAFVFAPPAVLLKDGLAEAVKAKTGRTLAVSGPVSFALFPSPGLVAHGVSLTGPEGAAGEPLATAEELDVRVALWPLVQRRLEITGLVLKKPVFSLRTGPDGRRNWEFRTAADAPPAAHPGNGSGAAPAGTRHARTALDGWGFGSVTIAGVRIEDGTVRYSDARKGVEYELSALTASAGPLPPAGPLPVNGSFALAGERTDFAIVLAAPADMARLGSGPLTASVSGRLMTAEFEGTFALGDGPSLEGRVTAKGASARALAARLGAGLPDAQGFGAFSVTGHLSAAPGTARLEEAVFDLGGTALSGSAEVTRSSGRPLWRGSLKADEIDLGHFQGGTQTADGGGRTPGSIEDLLQGSGPQVKGYTRRRGWSEEPADWSFLRAADAGLTLEVGHLVRHGLEAGPGVLTAAAADGRLTVAVKDMRFYGGRVRGTFAADASGSDPAMGLDISADGVDTGAFLKAAVGIGWLGGTGAVSASLSGSGHSERRFVETLSGTAKAAITEGTLGGIDIAGFTRSADGDRSGEGHKPSGRTEFTALTATFTVKNGVAENRDLELTGPLVSASGAGKVLLASREIDYTVRPRLAAPGGGAGQTPGTAPAALDIPVRARGAWDRPQFSADLGALAKDPDKAVSAIKEIGRKLKGKKLGDIIRGVLGKDGGN